MSRLREGVGQVKAAARFGFVAAAIGTSGFDAAAGPIHGVESAGLKIEQPVLFDVAHEFGDGSFSFRNANPWNFAIPVAWDLPRKITRMIDGFDQPTKESGLSVAGPRGTRASRQYPNLEVLGQERGVALTIHSPTGEAKSAVGVQDNVSNLKFTQTHPSASEMFVTWAGSRLPKEGEGHVPFANLESVDLSQNGGDRFLMRLKGNAPGEVVVRVYPVHDLDGKIYSTATIQFDPNHGYKEFQIPFASLVPGPNGGVDPRKGPVGAISLSVVQKQPGKVPCHCPDDAVTQVDFLAVAGVQPPSAEGGLIASPTGRGNFGSEVTCPSAPCFEPISFPTLGFVPGLGTGWGPGPPYNPPPDYVPSPNPGPPNHGPPPHDVVPEPSSRVLLITAVMTSLGAMGVKRALGSGNRRDL